MTTPVSIEALPIDDAARDGRFQLVFVEGRYALVRFVAEHWVFSSGVPFPGHPTHYQPRKD
ncbi:hypothetical protein HT136_01525 [Novosphingobium profundi]|uniref:hypothetical protein n=1 Tax=Novosphingobium profundi TaxID=1774954 RepID=UPI001BDAD99E|nr:hypothetical protein [Novosphingobium profundi]MBT0667047.1 hypothetical protein [Novosphingobium profundi]MED5546095.1 hypothetical protein [Pseudomonadota bacterium]MEE3154002.1 hypothetical protein [Pseudomonadota bacterium]